MEFAETLQAGTTLNRKYPDHPDHPDHSNVPNRELGIPDEKHGAHLIIASEPSTYKESDWHLIGKNQFLLAGPDGVFEVKDCPYGSGWDARD
jgi:glutamine amidotransferase